MFNNLTQKQKGILKRKPCYSCEHGNSADYCEKIKCWITPTYKYSWRESYKEIMVSWIFECFDKNRQSPCFYRG